jgi:two-component system alkaline phosphatase synthesis response regulator PhoP
VHGGYHQAGSKRLAATSIGSIKQRWDVKVLVVDDEKDITALVAYHLEREGFRVIQASDGFQALEMVKRERPNLLILDLMLPQMSGLDVCRRLRKEPETARLPILMLTAKAEETDKVLGLELGGDDYLTKPFGPRELVARVKALIRRSEEAPGEEVVKAGSLEVDLARYIVSVRKRPIELTAKEFELLKALILAKGRAITREHLLNRVWGYDQASEIESRTVDVHVRRLREKLGPEAKRIITVKNVGYRFAQDT